VLLLLLLLLVSAMQPPVEPADEELHDEIPLAGHRGSAHSLLIGCGLLAAWLLVSSRSPGGKSN